MIHSKPLLYCYYGWYYHSFSLYIGNTFIDYRKQDTDRQHFVVAIYNLFNYNILHKNTDVVVVTFFCWQYISVIISVVNMAKKSSSTNTQLYSCVWLLHFGMGTADALVTVWLPSDCCGLPHLSFFCQQLLLKYVRQSVETGLYSSLLKSNGAASSLSLLFCWTISLPDQNVLHLYSPRNEEVLTGSCHRLQWWRRLC